MFSQTDPLVWHFKAVAMDEPGGNLNFIIHVKMNVQQKIHNKHILFHIHVLPSISLHLATSRKSIYPCCYNSKEI